MKTQLAPISHSQSRNNPLVPNYPADDSLSFSNEILSPDRDLSGLTNQVKRRSLQGQQQTTDADKIMYSEPDNFSFKPLQAEQQNINVGPFDYRLPPKYDLQGYDLNILKEELKGKEQLIEELSHQLSSYNANVQALEGINRQLVNENNQLLSQVANQAKIIMENQNKQNVDQIFQLIDNVASENNQLKLLLNTRLEEITELKIQVSQNEQSVESLKRYKIEHELLLQVYNEITGKNQSLEKELNNQVKKNIQLEQELSNYQQLQEKNKNLEFEMLNWKHKYSILKEAYTSHQNSPLKSQCELAKPVGLIVQNKYFH